jgi:hypothetical protein
LGIVNAYERLDGLDDALGVPDQVTVCVLGPQAVSDPPQQPRQVHDFPVRSAHCCQTMVVGQEFR